VTLASSRYFGSLSAFGPWVIDEDSPNDVVVATGSIIDGLVIHAPVERTIAHHGVAHAKIVKLERMRLLGGPDVGTATRPLSGLPNVTLRFLAPRMAGSDVE
jgi:hypothetical protein